MPTANMLTGVLAEHVRAVNAFDTDAVVACAKSTCPVPASVSGSPPRQESPHSR